MKIIFGIFCVIFFGLNFSVVAITFNCNYGGTSIVYYGFNYTGYTCKVVALSGSGDQIEIQGDHMTGRNDNDVQLLINYRDDPSVYSGINFKDFFSTICDKFGNLKLIWFRNSGIEIFDGSWIKKCEKMEFLDLDKNKISKIFHIKSIVNLKYLNFHDNKI